MMKTILKLLLAGAAVAVQAGTTYTLPDPAVPVTVNETYNTISATLGSTYYSATSAFYYVSECAKPDSPTYHCNILAEDNLILNASGNTVVISLVIQSQSVLIRSGHNYWRHSNTILSGTLTTP
jgi:hypothetical protein